LTVRVAKATADEIAVCIEIRRVVFVLGQDVPEELEVDGLDPTCTHFLAAVDGEPAGTARLRITDNGAAKAERVAVFDRFRGRGVGAAVMRTLEAEAAKRGHSEVRLGAQCDVIPFYERLGYRAYGPVFDDAGIDHRMMKIALP
jgi:predicted GNAT family N-acyltransferase